MLNRSISGYLIFALPELIVLYLFNEFKISMA